MALTKNPKDWSLIGLILLIKLIPSIKPEITAKLIYSVIFSASVTRSKGSVSGGMNPRESNRIGVNIPIPYTPIPSHPQGIPLKIIFLIFPRTKSSFHEL